MSALGEYVHARKANYARYGISRTGGGSGLGSLEDVKMITDSQIQMLDSSKNSATAALLEETMNNILNKIELPDSSMTSVTPATYGERADFFDSFKRNAGVIYGAATSAFKETVRGALSGSIVSNEEMRAKSVITSALSYFNEITKENSKTNYRLASVLKNYCEKVRKEINDNTKLLKFVNSKTSLEEIQSYADELIILLSNIEGQLYQISNQLGRSEEYNFKLTKSMAGSLSNRDSILSQANNAILFLRKLSPNVSTKGLTVAGEAMGMTLAELAIPQLLSAIGNMLPEAKHTGSKSYNGFQVNMDVKLANKAEKFKKMLKKSNVVIKQTASSPTASFTISGRNQRADFTVSYNGNNDISSLTGFSVKNKMNLKSGRAGKIHIYDEAPLWNVFGRITNGIDLANHYMNLVSATVYNGFFSPEMGLDGVGNTDAGADLAKRAYLICALQGATADMSKADVDYLMVFERSAASAGTKFVRIFSISSVLGKLLQTGNFDDVLPKASDVGNPFIVEWAESGSAERIADTLAVLGRTLGPLDLTLAQLQSLNT